MVAGKLEARGRGYNNIKFTLQENLNSIANESIEIASLPNVNLNVKLVNGRTSNEGRLQVIYFF